MKRNSYTQSNHSNEKPEHRVVKIAIVGLPNTGKSQVYNTLTGDYTLVSNYPLTTVEIKRKQVDIKNRAYEIIDTPGLHRLSIQSEEELIVRDLLFREKPDGIIQCIDTNRIKQSLPLTLDLIELGIPMAISLNSIETSQKLAIDREKMSELLGVPVLEFSTLLDRGGEQLKNILTELRPGKWNVYYGTELESSIQRVQSILPKSDFIRKKAILLLCGDRYMFRSQNDVPGQDLENLLDEIDRSSRSNLGRQIHSLISDNVNAIASQVTVQRHFTPGRAAQTFAHLCRHPITGFPILAAVVVATYFLVVRVAGFFQTVLTELIITPSISSLDAILRPRLIRDFLIGNYGVLTLGIYNALITVIPILTVFFLMMGFLEDSGYLPNLSVLIRRFLSRIGLSGKSVMSLILGFGCKTMATLTTKGISSRKEKLIAVYLIAFAIPCSAQLAIDMAILGRVGFRAFLISYGTLAGLEIGVGYLLNLLIKDDSKSAFIQELPPIRIPQLKAVLKKTYFRLYWFLKEALPIFVIAAVALFIIDKTGLLNLLKHLLNPVVEGWLGLPIDVVDVLILSFARHEAAAGLLFNMVDNGVLSYSQSIVAVVITTMFVPCFANIVAMCKELGVYRGITIAVMINISSFVFAGFLHWILIFLHTGA